MTRTRTSDSTPSNRTAWKRFRLVSDASTDAVKPAKSVALTPTASTSGNRHTIANGRISSSPMVTGGPSSVHSIAAPSRITTSPPRWSTQPSPKSPIDRASATRMPDS